MRISLELFPFCAPKSKCKCEKIVRTNYYRFPSFAAGKIGFKIEREWVSFGAPSFVKETLFVARNEYFFHEWPKSAGSTISFYLFIFFMKTKVGN